jgi:hypothetical protein
MRWLVVVGVSIDLAGAALVGWSVYAQSAVERREEAVTRFGGNFWVILFREEEQAYVRAGLSLLVLGFSLQLIGYVGGFGWPGGAAALLIALLVAGGAFFVGDKVAGRAVPLKLSRPDKRPAIGDERTNFGVETLQDVETLRHLYASRMHGKTLQPRQHIVRPEISGGNWIFRCPDCGPSNVNLATPGLKTVVCTSCFGEFPARFPTNRAEIERVLVERWAKPEERNWKVGQSTEELLGNGPPE